MGHLPAVSPGNLDRFTDNGDGTVTDNLTRLVWLQDASCSDLAGTNGYGAGNWTTAFSAANSLASGTCGLTDGSSAGDWRLPNFNELHSLVVDSGQTNPALPPGHPFTDVQSTGYYWSSTTLAASPSYAWDLGMASGTAHNWPKSFLDFVWPIRGGQ